MSVLRINAQLDLEAIRETYRRDGVVQISPLFEPEAAEAIEKALLNLPFKLLLQDEAGGNMLLGQAELSEISPQRRATLEKLSRERAAKSYGYTYRYFPMISARHRNDPAGHSIHGLTEFLTTSPFIDLAKAVISCPTLTRVDCHASCYLPGHYLTRHIDDGERNERRAAYTIGFSRDWMTDWGGLLLFLSGDGDVINGFLPRFNTLTIFDGLRIHTVTQVSTFAQRPRLSIAGWFRDDPVR